MKTRTLALAATLAALGCSTAVAAPATVGLRVEGETTTIFEGTVTTDGHAIEQDASGPHPCDGTNAGTNPAPGPTITSALDDGIAWDGRWSDGFQDFLVNRIGPDRNDATSNQFWGFAVNYQASQLGGCQQQVKPGDEILFAYDFFSAERYLRLSGPRQVRQGRRFRVRVVDGQTGNPVEGARVLSKLTNERGYARARLRGRGVRDAKAVQEGAVRSNALRIRVR